MKEVQAPILNVPVLLSPISPKPTKGKKLVRPKTAAISETSNVNFAPAKQDKELELILKRFAEENPGVMLVKIQKTRKKSTHL